MSTIISSYLYGIPLLLLAKEETVGIMSVYQILVFFYFIFQFLFYQSYLDTDKKTIHSPYS